MRKCQNKIRKDQKLRHDEEYKVQLSMIEAEASDSLRFAIKLAREKGASSWVTARPLHTHSTVLHKGDFRDAIHIRYGWEPLNLPARCGCGEPFEVAHAMTCMAGGFRGLMHNEVEYLYSVAFKEAGYKDVVREPHLQPLTGENLAKFKSANREDEARSDIRVLGFWSRLRRAFFDITAFSPYARSNRPRSMKSLYRSAERRKYREYHQRILDVEHGDFNPLVFSSSGGMGPQAAMVTKRLCQKLAEVQDLPVAEVTGWLRCRVSFALLRSTLICLRGSRPYRPKKDKEEIVIELAVAETRLEIARGTKRKTMEKAEMQRWSRE